MDMQQLAFPSATFDALWVCASIPHIPETAAPTALDEFGRVLKANGIMFVNYLVSSRKMYVESAIEMGDYGAPGRFFQAYMDPVGFEQLVESAGFAIVETISKTVNGRLVDKSSWDRSWNNLYCKVKSSSFVAQ